MDNKITNMTGICTDLYQLTMAQGYWKKGLAERQAVFYSTFRKAPYDGGFSIFCGLGSLADFLDNFGFAKDDLDYLSSLASPDKTRLFESDFIEYLGKMRLSCDIYSVPEGSVVFPGTPLIRIQGPLIQCQILETSVLNIINHQTLIATKAARVCMAARGQQVLEFGFRRAHGPDGALSCSRAAFIGGCSATSNVLAGKKFGIPVRGTMAHSWVMQFDSEKEAFEAYADISSDSYVLLVDTYDTLSGVKNAVDIAKKMVLKGKMLAGVRLDSGDIANLSVETRKILDANGFYKTIIIASNDLDEESILSLKSSGAPIDAWGVGTKLVTSAGHSALDGVYKLSAIQNKHGLLEPRLKLSDHPIKNSLPGVLQTRRYISNEQYAADIVHDESLTQNRLNEAVNFDGTGKIHIEKLKIHDDLLKKVFDSGNRAYEMPGINEIREFTMNELDRFSPDVINITITPDKYLVGMEKGLAQLKAKLAESFKEKRGRRT